MYPLFIYLLKQVLEHVLKVINAIVNGSLVESTILLSFKKVNARLLLKKANLDEQVLKN